MRVSWRRKFLWGTQGDVTGDDSQRRFLGQHSVVMPEQCCIRSKQCRNDVETLCCAKNRRNCDPGAGGGGGGTYESSRATSPLCRYDMYETWVLLTRLFVWFCKSALANIRKFSDLHKRNLKKMITCFKGAIRSRGYRYFRDQFYAEVITECIPVHQMSWRRYNTISSGLT